MSRGAQALASAIVLLIVLLGVSGQGQSKRASCACGDSTDQQAPSLALRESVEAMSCGQIASCVDSCAALCPEDLRWVFCLLECNKTCQAKGCASARRAYQRLSSCAQDKCLRACTSGPLKQCKRCTKKHCAQAIHRCEANSCRAAEPKRAEPAERNPRPKEAAESPARSRSSDKAHEG